MKKFFTIALLASAGLLASQPKSSSVAQAQAILNQQVNVRLDSNLHSGKDQGTSQETVPYSDRTGARRGYHAEAEGYHIGMIPQG